LLWGCPWTSASEAIVHALHSLLGGDSAQAATHQERRSVIVSVSTECFPELSLAKSMERLAELEYTAVEIDVHEHGGHLQPARVAANPDLAIRECSDLQRLRPVAVSFVAAESPTMYDQFESCCRLAKSLGVARAVALVHKPDYVSLYQRLGIDVAVSPRLLCANRILAFVRSRSISTVATIEEGKAEVLELELPSGSDLVGKSLKDAGFPRGCVVAAITREDGTVLIPRGDDELHAHDQLVLFVLHRVVDQVLASSGDRSWHGGASLGCRSFVVIGLGRDVSVGVAPWDRVRLASAHAQAEVFD
jgi:hypothetical protein